MGELMLSPDSQGAYFYGEPASKGKGGKGSEYGGRKRRGRAKGSEKIGNIGPFLGCNIRRNLVSIRSCPTEQWLLSYLVKFLSQENSQ